MRLFYKNVLDYCWICIHFFLDFWVEIHQLKNYAILVFEWQFSSEKLLEEKNVIVELGESQP